eukprot:11022762-Lingulodinium_polyedra.AAC.1
MHVCSLACERNCSLHVERCAGSPSDRTSSTACETRLREKASVRPPAALRTPSATVRLSPDV